MHTYIALKPDNNAVCAIYCSHVVYMVNDHLRLSVHQDIEPGKKGEIPHLKNPLQGTSAIYIFE